MKIEHVAFNVKDPVAQAAWYVENLRMKVVRRGGAPAWAHFLADSSGSVMLEIYCNDKAPVPDYFSQDPLVFHLAFKCGDVRGKRDELLAAGATLVGDMDPAMADEIVMLRDPWGVPVQLVRRAEEMV